MKIKYVILLIILLILTGIGIVMRMYFKPHANMSNLKPEFKVDAAVLLAEFQNDENKATIKYSEKVLEINGKLVAKSTLQNGTKVLILENEMEGISCQLDSLWASANQTRINSIASGDVIKVKGICKGYLMEIKVSPAVIVDK